METIERSEFEEPTREGIQVHIAEASQRLAEPRGTNQSRKTLVARGRQTDDDRSEGVAWTTSQPSGGGESKHYEEQATPQVHQNERRLVADPTSDQSGKEEEKPLVAERVPAVERILGREIPLLKLPYYREVGHEIGAEVGAIGDAFRRFLPDSQVRQGHQTHRHR